MTTVVQVEGSSYRSPGACILITDIGVDSTSERCLEDDAQRKARQVITDRQEYSSTFNTTDDENSELRINLAL